MSTENHNLDYPAPGSYVTDFEDLADHADRMVILWGTLDDRPAPVEGLLYLDIEGTENDDADTVLYAAVDDGSGTIVWDVVDLEIAQDLSTATHYDQEETLYNAWVWEQTFQTDIAGHATYAENATHAVTAAAASVVGGHTGDEFVSTVVPFQITGVWTFEDEQIYHRTVDVTGGVLGFPAYGEF